MLAFRHEARLSRLGPRLKRAGVGHCDADASEGISTDARLARYRWADLVLVDRSGSGTLRRHPT